MPKSNKSSKTSKSKGSDKKSKKSPPKVIEPDPLVVVTEIIEEFSSNLLDKIYRLELQKATIEFMLKCTNIALMRIMDFTLYFHDKSEQTWIPDTPIGPSPPDSWAGNQIQIRPKVRAYTKVKTQVTIKEMEKTENETAQTKGIVKAKVQKKKKIIKRTK